MSGTGGIGRKLKPPGHWYQIRSTWRRAYALTDACRAAAKNGGWRDQWAHFILATWGLRRRLEMARKVKKSAFDPKVFLAAVNGGRTLSDYRKGDVIFSQGEAADAVFYIQSGKVKIAVTSDQGKEAVIAVLGTGEFFGEGCLIAQLLRLAAATAMTDSVVTRVDKAQMIRVLHDEPAFAELFTHHLLTRNSRVEEDLVDQLFNSSEKRLARTLLLLASFGKDGAPQPIATKISQETLAEMIGTTRSRVSFFMNKFRKLGFIEYNGKIEVHSSLLSIVLRE
jgi:CRP/FNR family transcriptional regulator, cyclic AMP receptor protein